VRPRRLPCACMRLCALLRAACACMGSAPFPPALLLLAAQPRCPVALHPMYACGTLLHRPAAELRLMHACMHAHPCAAQPAGAPAASLSGTCMSAGRVCSARGAQDHPRHESRRAQRQAARGQGAVECSQRAAECLRHWLCSSGQGALDCRRREQPAFWIGTCCSEWCWQSGHTRRAAAGHAPPSWRIRGSCLGSAVAACVAGASGLVEVHDRGRNIGRAGAAKLPCVVHATCQHVPHTARPTAGFILR
jgi:hypothetical protein